MPDISFAIIILISEMDKKGKNLEGCGEDWIRLNNWPCERRALPISHPSFVYINT